MEGMMKRIVFLLTMTATAADAQSTICQQAANQVYCNSYNNQPQGDNGVNSLITKMLSPQNVNNPNDEAAEEASKNRRAAAYAQVGDLIAQGKCTEARNLAKFYNHPDIIADTAKACPL